MDPIKARQAYGIHRGSDYNNMPRNKYVEIAVFAILIVGGVVRYALPLWWLLT